MIFRKPSEIVVEERTATAVGYPAHLQFAKEAGGTDDQAFWFHDGLHHPRPMRPFETIVPEAIKLGLSQANNRLFSFPMSYGIDQRIINGYIYFSPTGPDLKNTDLIQSRSEEFQKRAGVYFDKWDEIYNLWLNKVEIQTKRISELSIPELDGVDDFSVISSHSGIGSGYRLSAVFNDICDALFLVWQYHFEMLSLGYAAYLNFRGTVKALFPSISDSDVIEMLAGSSSVLYRPKEELQRLALSAINLNLDDKIARLQPPINSETILAVGNVDWTNDWKSTANTWFEYSNGTGFYFDDGTWNEDWSVPWDLLKSYIRSARDGSLNLRNVSETRSARDITVRKYRQLMETAEERTAFDEAYALALKVAPYLEDHNYYIEHRFHAAFWSQLKRLGRALCALSIFEKDEDIFLFNRWEVGQLLYEVAASWANGTLENRAKLQKEIFCRREQHRLFEAWTPPPALGSTPSNLADPLVAVLWGIDDAKVAQWTGSLPTNEVGSLRGLPTDRPRPIIPN